MSRDLATMLQALGRYLTATCHHERQPDPLRPWLRVAAPPCSACADLRTALGLEEETRPSGSGEAAP
ncbi:MAG TPA: hypothetical protein VK688_11480 [Gemmatimonadales bacterium]|jgi:hypothetical protein|nr:hypothetical protein [Gemmatimonadales bacterium]